MMNRFVKNIPGRKVESNKGTYKRVLVIGGSHGMCGASYLAAFAAYRSGAGLVGIYAPEENRVILQTLIPEAIVYTYETDEPVRNLDQYISKAGVIVLGPGLSTADYAYAIVSQVLETAKCPIILDADGLNIVSEHTELKNKIDERIIVTPHPGEMARLTGREIPDILSNTEQYAREFAKEHNCVCVLKTHRTVVAGPSGKTYTNKIKAPELSKGGSGDVLSGIIAGMVCMGFSNMEAAATGVDLHAKAGVKAGRLYGSNGCLASDFAHMIGADQ